MKKENNYFNFLYYKVVGQKVRSCRIAKGYTQKDLAKKIGVTYQIVLQYEKGTRKISIEKLYAIAEVLSINITDLIPVSSEKVCLKNKEEEILNLIREYKKISGQELRKMFCLLTKFIQVSEKSSKKAEKVKIAKGLVKAGVSVDIVAKTIGLSADECVEEKGGSIYCQIGKKIKDINYVFKKISYLCDFAVLPNYMGNKNPFAIEIELYIKQLLQQFLFKPMNM